MALARAFSCTYQGCYGALVICFHPSYNRCTQKCAQRARQKAVFATAPYYDALAREGSDRLDFIRIGDKLIRRDKIISTIDQVLQLRADGASQQEVAKELSLDRTFISRLETLGEVRKGGTIALVGFPILNKVEITRMAMEEGIDFTLVMTEQERLDFVRMKSGLELLNEVMAIITKVRQFDTVILLGSNNRVRLSSALLDKEIIGIEIGESPLQQDQIVDIVQVRAMVRELKGP